MITPHIRVFVEVLGILDLPFKRDGVGIDAVDHSELHFFQIVKMHKPALVDQLLAGLAQIPIRLLLGGHALGQVLNGLHGQRRDELVLLFRVIGILEIQIEYGLGGLLGDLANGPIGVAVLLERVDIPPVAAGASDVGQAQQVAQDRDRGEIHVLTVLALRQELRDELGVLLCGNGDQGIHRILDAVDGPLEEVISLLRRGEDLDDGALFSVYEGGLHGILRIRMGIGAVVRDLDASAQALDVDHDGHDVGWVCIRVGGGRLGVLPAGGEKGQRHDERQQHGDDLFHLAKLSLV